MLAALRGELLQETETPPVVSLESKTQILENSTSDDLIATGGTAEAASKLIEISKGSVAGFIFIINLFDLGGYDALPYKYYKVINQWEMIDKSAEKNYFRGGKLNEWNY